MDFTQLFVQCVCSGVVDFQNNCENLYTLIDMTASLIHSALVPEREGSSNDHQVRSEENRKAYGTLTKRLRKVGRTVGTLSFLPSVFFFFKFLDVYYGLHVSSLSRFHLPVVGCCFMNVPEDL